MSFPRRCVVNAFLLVLLGLVARTIRSNHEPWPICSYPMFDQVNVHPEADSFEFYTQAPGEPEEWIHEDASIGKLHHEFAFRDILAEGSWPSARARDELLSIVEEMRTERAPYDPAWREPVTLRAYCVPYRCVRSGDVRLVITGRTAVLQLTDPEP
jgi:hypothetical protein